MKKFCHIAPTSYLNLVSGRPIHLALAHLVQHHSSNEYIDFYKKENENGSTIILDNSAFEMIKQGKKLYPSDKLIDMGKKIDADYIVLSDYPGEHSSFTIAAGVRYAKKFKDAGFKTFFVPQSQIGDQEDYINCFEWASESNDVDYIGVSILGVPNSYGSIEKNNKLQRFLSRLDMMYKLKKLGILDKCKQNGKKIHFLGMLDGPNEIKFMNPFKDYIDSWDSSSAVWAGLNDISYDNSPTGLINGKFEKEVNFSFDPSKLVNPSKAKRNIEYIDQLIQEYLN